jgi:hypothetical protein
MERNLQKTSGAGSGNRKKQKTNSDHLEIPDLLTSEVMYLETDFKSFFPDRSYFVNVHDQKIYHYTFL